MRYERALSEGKTEEARSYAQMTSRLKDYMADDSKRLLQHMGVPWVQAPSEGEAQAAYLARKGEADYCSSQDFDSLLFGAPFLLRNLTISGRRKLPRKKVYVEVVPEVVEMRRVLAELGVTREQLVDIGILIGTDFNPDGIKGVGPKTALKLVKKHGSLEGAVSGLEGAEFPVDPERIREVFLNPRVTDRYRLPFGAPDVEGIVGFLCGEKDFSVDRVRRALGRTVEGMKEAKAKTTLEAWF